MAAEKPDDLNLGLEIFLEWGPALAIPVAKRLKAALPNLSDEAIAKLIGEYGDIRSKAGAIVIDQLESKRTESESRSRVAAIDPRVSDGNSSMLYTQARVTAWRDGYS
jgi:hypothetical protein